MRGAATAGMVLLLAGCAQTADTVRVVGDSAPSFDPKQIGKSDIDRVAETIYGTPRRRDAGRGLEREARHNILTGRDSAQNAAGMV